MKRIHVVAGIIWNKDQSQLLISRRPQHLHKGGYWEFPGGKVEAGESELSALARELQEELGIQFSSASVFSSIDYDYPDKSVRLDFFEVFDISGEITPNEGQEWRWVALADLPDYEFPEANRHVVDKLQAVYLSSSPPSS